MTKISTVCAIFVFFLALMIGFNPGQRLLSGFFGDLYYAKGPLEVVVSLAMLAIGVFFGWLVLKAYDQKSELLAGLALQPATFFITLGGGRCLIHYLAFFDQMKNAAGG